MPNNSNNNNNNCTFAYSITIITNVALLGSRWARSSALQCGAPAAPQLNNGVPIRAEAAPSLQPRLLYICMAYII